MKCEEARCVITKHLEFISWPGTEESSEQHELPEAVLHVKNCPESDCSKLRYVIRRTVSELNKSCQCHNNDCSNRNNRHSDNESNGWNGDY